MAPVLGRYPRLALICASLTLDTWLRGDPRFGGRLRNLHFFPNAAFLLPVVKGFAVDLVNGCFRNGQFAGLYHHKEINVVNFAVGAFHVDTGEVFIAAKIREPVVVKFDQVEREIFTLIRDMKFVVGRFRCVAADESLKSV